MRQSNLYILIYSAILTIVCGGLLAFASQALKPRQDANIELERKANILSTVITLEKGADITKLYESRIRELVIDFNGNLVDKKAAEINVPAEYKKKPQDRFLPVFEFGSAEEPGKVESLVIPVYGFGLWNNIGGFVALASDLNTIKGVSYSHVGETPGLASVAVHRERLAAQRSSYERMNRALTYLPGSIDIEWSDGAGRELILTVIVVC